MSKWSKLWLDWSKESIAMYTYHQDLNKNICEVELGNNSIIDYGGQRQGKAFASEETHDAIKPLRRRLAGYVNGNNGWKLQRVFNSVRKCWGALRNVGGALRKYLRVDKNLCGLFN